MVRLLSGNEFCFMVFLWCKRNGRRWSQLLCRLACGAATNASWTAVSMYWSPQPLGQLGGVWGCRTACACLLRPEKPHSLIPVQNIQGIVSTHNDMETTGNSYSNASSNSPSFPLGSPVTSGIWLSFLNFNILNLQKIQSDLWFGLDKICDTIKYIKSHVRQKKIKTKEKYKTSGSLPLWGSLTLWVWQKLLLDIV